MTNKDWLLTYEEIKKAIDDADYSSVIDGNVLFPNMQAEIDKIKGEAVSQAQIDKLIRLGWKSPEEVAEFGLSVNEAAIELGRQQERERIFKGLNKFRDNGLETGNGSKAISFIFSRREWETFRQAPEEGKK